jgi:hypothetical protein
MQAARSLSTDTVLLPFFSLSVSHLIILHMFMHYAGVTVYVTLHINESNFCIASCLTTADITLQFRAVSNNCKCCATYNLEGQVPVFISPRNRVAQLYPRALGSLLSPLTTRRDCGGGIITRLHTGKNVYTNKHSLCHWISST